MKTCNKILPKKSQNPSIVYFDIDKHLIKRISLTTRDIYEQIKYDDNKKIDWWYHQVENFLEGKKLHNKILDETLLNKTWSLPPVIIHSNLAKKIKKNYG